MSFTAKQILGYSIWALTVFLLASFQIFDQYSWGRYSFVICSAVILFLVALKNDGKIHINFGIYHLLFLVFIIYVFLNCFWSQQSNETLSTVMVLLRIWFCFTLLYWAYSNLEDCSISLVQSICASSYVIAIYSVFRYGWDNISIATHEYRLDNEYANINSIAIFLAIGIICDLYLYFLHGFRIHSIISFLSLFLLAASQSRKAIVALVFGILALLILKYTQNTGFLIKVIRTLFIILIIVFMLYFMSKLFVFSGLNHRVDQWLNSITGNGKADESSIVRNKLITIGLDTWWQHPFFGVGINTMTMITRGYLYSSYYTHNNYVELLSGGGVFAFAAFYSMHAYVIAKLIANKNNNYSLFVIGMVLMVVILVTDFGRVSYYSKTIHFFLLLLFIIVKEAEKSREGNGLAEKNTSIPLRS